VRVRAAVHDQDVARLRQLRRRHRRPRARRRPRGGSRTRPGGWRMTVNASSTACMVVNAGGNDRRLGLCDQLRSCATDVLVGSGTHLRQDESTPGR
jgi:hypothetical protein